MNDKGKLYPNAILHNNDNTNPYNQQSNLHIFLNEETDHCYSNFNEYINMCIFDLRYFNTLDLEILILRLLKSLNKPLHSQEIYDAICIVRNIKKEELENTLLIQSSFKLVEFEKWALAEWNQYEVININSENYIKYINYCMVNLRYFDTIDLEILIKRLFKNLNKPLYSQEIYDAICILRSIDKEDLESILFINPSFKLIEIEKWALAEWNQYEEIIVNFENYIEYIKKIFKGNHWKCFEYYKLTDTKETYETIAKIFNISRERVRQIVNSVTIKLNKTNYRKHTDFYIVALKKILNDNDYILIGNYPEDYKKVFGNWNIKKIVTFLNTMGGDFIYYKDKYFICNTKITNITNILENSCLTLINEQICESYLDEIIKLNNLTNSLEKEIVLDCIKQDNRFFLCKDYQKFFYKKCDISTADILNLIFHRLDRPATIKFLSHQYTSLTGKNLSYDSFTFYMKNDSRFIKLYDTVYGLSCWTDKKHKFNEHDVYDIEEKTHKKNPLERITNLVIDVLTNHQGSMYYLDIYELIRDKTSASKHSLRMLLDRDLRIQELLSGYYKIRDTK